MLISLFDRRNERSNRVALARLVEKKLFSPLNYLGGIQIVKDLLVKLIEGDC